MPKKKIGNHLQFYMDCMKAGYMPCAGLCGCALDSDISPRILELMEPTDEDSDKLDDEKYCTAWWASGKRNMMPGRLYSFTPLRQTIVLFMAALNNEL